jgi:hypothetical protein
MENLSTPQTTSTNPANNTATNLVLPSVGQQLTYPLDYTTQEILIDFIKRLPVYPVQYTTAQRDVLRPTTGMLIYNLTTNKMNFYNGTAWEVITSA